MCIHTYINIYAQHIHIHFNDIFPSEWMLLPARLKKKKKPNTVVTRPFLSVWLEKSKRLQNHYRPLLLHLVTPTAKVESKSVLLKTPCTLDTSELDLGLKAYWLKKLLQKTTTDKTHRTSDLLVPSFNWCMYNGIVAASEVGGSDSIRKETEQAMMSKSLSTTPPGSLYRLLPRGSCPVWIPDFFQW